jgi:superfamily II DNA or RNA helicase/HKD family nuclease
LCENGAGVPRDLADGLYEHLITGELSQSIAGLAAGRSAATERIAQAELHEVLARYLGREIARVIAAVSAEQREESALALVHRVLGQLAPEGPSSDGSEVAAPARRLLAVFRGAQPERPETPLALSTLLTRNPAEPAIGHELAREIASADRIDVIVAFVTVGGIRRIWDRLEAFARRQHVRPDRMRVLTTTFTGTTEQQALNRLASLPGVTVKVSYDVRRTRLHAKAWLFHRDSGLSTAYVGSANLTATALGEGHEWMVKVCADDLPHVIEKFEGTFETLWADPEFEPYDPGRADDRARLAAALGAEAGNSNATVLFDLRPYPFQEEILDRLQAARLVHGRTRNLVVAATGTGKTVIAAIDYARIAAAQGVTPRLLFLAHRKEILQASRDTFRHALRDASFGELLVSGRRPARFEHVFATIRSAAGLIEELGVDHFQHVVVDECHHMPADSYQALIPRLRPQQLVGLTATPERSDGQSLLPDFDGHVAAELRLWHALDRQLLAPFEYYGISDGVDLSRVRWSRSGYDLAALDGIYTGHSSRARLVHAQLVNRVADVRKIRALGFCVSVAHAEFMTAEFCARGVPALCVHGDSEDVERSEAPRRLREREVNVLFTCDLYNEGVDLPFVDTLLLLRPTMSATLFMQQLGRGLRLDPASRKTGCLVLDFIGQHREEYRFDAVLSAMTGVPRARLRKAVEDEFPLLPSGCSVHLDQVAREVILDSLKATLGGAKRLAAELRELEAREGRPLRLLEYLDQSGRELDDVYTDSHGWGMLRRLAQGSAVEEEAEDLSRRLGWLAHVDEPARLKSYADVLAAAKDGQTLAVRDADRVRWQMLGFQLSHRGVLRSAEEVVAELTAHREIPAEFEELREVLEERVGLPEDRYPVEDWPLALHRHYERREIVAAVGFVVPGQKGKLPQGGILQLKAQRRELLFVTLDKTGRGFSPTTRYRDYAISPNTFHWETQASASVARESGQRYLAQDNGWSFFLFVRTARESPYAFLGRVRYVSHAGDRPIGITWRLDAPMPAMLFERYATLASG